MTKAAGAWVRQKVRDRIERELEPICGVRAPQVLELALHYAGRETVPEDSHRLRRFVHVDLQNALETMLGDLAIAQRITDVVAGAVLDTTGIVKLPEARRSGISCASERDQIPPPATPAAPSARRRRRSVGELLMDCIEKARTSLLPPRAQTRARVSETREVIVFRHRDFAEERVTAAPQARTSRTPSQDAAAVPVLVLSERPEACHQIQDMLFKRVDVMHHEGLEHLESDLHALRHLDPVLVLDGRGKYQAFGARYIARCPSDARVVLWGIRRVEGARLGSRMVEISERRKAREVAQVLGALLPAGSLGTKKA